MEACDVGSLPPPDGGLEEGRRKYAAGEGGPEAEHFERAVVSSFLDKVRCGLTLPNYPQFSDMITSFLEPMRGVRRRGEGYVLEEEPSVREEVLPELKALLSQAGRLREEAGEVRMKVCVTGPYTLASLFPGWDESLFTLLSRPLARLVSSNLPRELGVELLSLDEPVFGVDDPRLDRGSEGREVLLKAWEEVLGAAKRKGVKTLLHLHNTSDGLFWELENLDAVESHVGDPLYSSPETPLLLERKDKVLKASIARTDFDKLLEERVGGRVGEVWKEIRAGRERAERYLEEEREMELRLRKVVERFGRERVPYAGPECGLGGFPTYESALECLRRVGRACAGLRGA